MLHTHTRTTHARTHISRKEDIPLFNSMQQELDVGSEQQRFGSACELSQQTRSQKVVQ
jgi:hypothetical protein